MELTAFQAFNWASSSSFSVGTNLQGRLPARVQHSRAGHRGHPRLARDQVAVLRHGHRDVLRPAGARRPADLFLHGHRPEVGHRKPDQGGQAACLLLGATLVYMVLQNVVGVSVATMTGLDRWSASSAARPSLIGGHGTTIAWAPIFAEQYGVVNALEIGIARATVGLILAALMGEADREILIERYKLEPETMQEPDFGTAYDGKKVAEINYIGVLYTWLIMNVAIGFGLTINECA